MSSSRIFTRITLLAFLVVSLSACWLKSSEELLAEIQQQLSDGDYRSAEISAKSLLGDAQQQADSELQRATRLLLARTYFNSGDNTNSARFYDALPEPVSTDAEPVSASIKAGDNDWHQWLLAAWESGQPRLAASILQQPAAPFGEQARAIYKIRQLLAEGSGEDALAVFELTAAPGQQESHFVHYQYLLMLASSDPQAALEGTAELTRQQPQFAQALLLQARLSQAAGDHEPALTQFTDYLKLRPADAQARILTALTAFQMGQYESARPLIKSLAKQARQHPMVLQLQGMLALHDKNYEQAKSFAEQSLSSGLDTPMNHLLLGVAAYQQQSWERANRHLAVINEQLPKDHFARKMLVETKLQLNDTSNAAAIFKDINTGSLVDVALANRVSAKLMNEGGYQMASSIQQQVAGIEVDEDELLLQQRVLSQALKRNEFKQALIESIKGQDFEAADKLRLILLHIADNELDQASRMSREWLLQSPEDVNALNAAALVEQRAGNTARVKQYLQKALSIDPKNIPSLVMQLSMARIDEQLPTVVSISETLMQDLGFINPLVFNYWLEANMLQQQLPWQKALDLVAADKDNQLEGALLSFFLKSRRYDLSERYLAERVPAEQWSVRHWATAIMSATGAGQVERTAQLVQQLMQSAVFDNARITNFAIASAARVGRFELVLAALEAADKRDIAIKNRDLLASSAYLQLGQKDKARQLLAEHPLQDSAYYEVKSDLAMAEKKYDQAWEDLQKAIVPQIKFDHLVRMFEVGNKINQRSKVKEYIRDYFEARPNDNLARRRAAQWYMQDSPRFAIELLDSDPMQQQMKNDWVTTNNLAWLYHQIGEQEKAEYFAMHAIFHAPEREEVIDTYTTVFGRKPGG